MSLFDRASYRFRQLRRTLWPHVKPSEREEARGVLGANLYPLFASMQDADQRHCVDVCHRLVRNGSTDVEMLQTALLHDAGKGHIAGARFGVHHRVAYVALERFPRVLDGLTRHNRGLRSLREHARRTIELAHEYGASDGVVRLLQAMDGAASDERMATLRVADDQS